MNLKYKSSTSADYFVTLTWNLFCAGLEISLENSNERLEFGDVADFLYIEACEIDDIDIDNAAKEVIEYYELKDF